MSEKAYEETQRALRELRRMTPISERNSKYYGLYNSLLVIASDIKKLTRAEGEAK